ncbi:MAG: ribosomal RNA small subunit methyltransferase A [Desulfobulbaceae bacterium]|nr:MAG: ribosomal RNA small subunit methyltransferase A [Desulfobulbaceae bacterium]
MGARLNKLNVRQILSEWGLAPNRQLGQNFLIQPQVAEQIVAVSGVESDDTVVELGVGLGALTLPLAARVNQVIGLEIDAGIIRYHRESHDLPPNVELRHQDLLLADFSALARQQGKRLKIIANLPYAITNPLLFKLVEQRQAIKQAVLMVQKEVAWRLSAKPNTKEYGVLSVLLGTCAQVIKRLEVDPDNFYPKPQVDSYVISITFTAGPNPEEFTRLRRVVNAAFNQRRKTLLNSLRAGAGLNLDRAAVEAGLAAANINPRLRAENLSPEDFLRLTRSIAELPAA